MNNRISLTPKNTTEYTEGKLLQRTYLNKKVNAGKGLSNIKYYFVAT